MTVYTHKPWRVRAVYWSGSNYGDIERFFADNADAFPPDCKPTFDVDPATYTVVQFTAWGRDWELEPRDWLVLHEPGSVPAGEVLDDEAFRDAYEAVAA